MKQHHDFLILSLDKVVFYDKLHKLKHNYFKSSIVPCLKIVWFMEDLQNLINEYKEKENTRFNLLDKLEECEKANKQLETLFKSMFYELHDDNTPKQRLNYLEKQLDDAVSNIGK